MHGREKALRVVGKVSCAPSVSYRRCLRKWVGTRLGSVGGDFAFASGHAVAEPFSVAVAILPFDCGRSV